MIYLSGRESFHDFEDPRLRKLVNASYNKVCARIARAQKELIIYTVVSDHDLMQDVIEFCVDGELLGRVGFDALLPLL